MSRDFLLFGQQVDHRVGRLGIELGGVGAVHAGDVTGELDHRDLHPEADPEVGDPLLAGDLGGADLALDAALAEAAGDQDPVEALERLLVEVLRVDEVDFDVHAVVDAAVLERLDHRLVGVLQLHVLADDRDPHVAGGIVGTPHHRLPVAQVGRGRLQAEVVEDQVIDALGPEDERDLVDVVDVVGGDHSVHRDAGEEGDLLADLAVEAPFGAADQHVRLDPDPAQLVDRVLGRLRLQFAGVPDVGHQGQVDEHRPLRAELRVELADRLEERQRLDVADRAADLRDHEVDRLGLRDDADFLLDLVGDVRDHLDGRAEVVAAPLAPDHRVVDAARGDVRCPRGVFVGEALVVAEVEIGLRAVLGDEDLAVLERAHRPRIDVDVGVELLQLDPVAAGDEQAPDRGRGDPLAEGRHDTSGNEDESGVALVGWAHALPSESSQRRGGTLSIVAEIDRNSP